MTSAASVIRGALAGVALAGITALAAGCGSASPQAGSTASSAPPAGSSSTPAAGSTAPSTPATSPAASAPPTPASGAAPCPTRDLGIKLGVSQGTAGSVYTVLDFTNIGSAACTLYGYPGVSFGAGTPVKQVGLAAAENKTPPRQLVTLRPGQVGNALLRIVDAGNFSPSDCSPVTATWLQIYPPGQTTPAYLHYTSQTCSKSVQTLQVNVVQPGSGSSS